MVDFIDLSEGLVISVGDEVGKAVTATLPAPPAGRYHGIAFLSISKYAGQDLVGENEPIIVNTTNFLQDLSISFPTLALKGELDRFTFSPAIPVRVSQAATETLIQCPATPGVGWRVNVFYGIVKSFVLQ